MNRYSREIVVAVVCGLLAMTAVPPFPDFFGADLLAGGAVFRGLLCGVAVGAAMRHTGLVGSAGLAAAVGVVGSLLAAGIGVSFASPPGTQSDWLLSALITPVTATVVCVAASYAVKRGLVPYVRAFAIAALLLAGTWSLGLWGEAHTHQQAHYTLLNQPVPLGQYDFDGDLYMRIDQEIKKGQPYYESVLAMVRSDPRRGPMVTSALNVRQPLVFWLFAAMPGPAAALLWWFAIFWVGVVATTGYLIAEHYLGASGGVAAGAMLLMLGFPAAWLPPQWFAFPEFWSSGMILIAVLALLKRHWWTALSFFLIAVAMREFAVLLIPAILLRWAVEPGRRPGIVYAIAATTMPIAIIGAHLLAVPNLVSGGAPVSVDAWLHGSWSQFLAGLGFLWAGGIPELQWSGYLLPVSCLVGALMIRPLRASMPVIAAIGALCVFMLLFGAGGDSANYWGAFSTPLFIVLSLLPLRRYVPGEGMESAEAVQEGASH